MSVKVSMNVNGKAVSADVPERTLLVSFIRENLRLTGTHVGCDTAQCGACTIHLNGKAVKSCNILAMQAEGAEVTTIEGIAKADGTLHPMQEAFHERHRPGEEHAQPDGSADPRAARWQHLPLHGLPQHRQGHRRRRAKDGVRDRAACCAGSAVLSVTSD